MVEAGQLQLIGTLDTTDIERGQRKIQVGFDNVQAKTDSSVGSLSSLAGVSKGLLTTFAGLGAVAGGALIGIAANSPQAAASIARIKAQSQQLSFAVGEELAPAFERAADLYANFVDSASTDGTLINTTLETFGNLLEGGLNRVEDIQDAFNSLSQSDFFKWINNTGSKGGTQPTLTQGLATEQGTDSPLIQGGITAGGGLSAYKALQFLGMNVPALKTASLGLGGLDALDSASNSQNDYLRTVALGTGFGAATGAFGGPFGAAAGAGIGFVGGNLYYGGQQAYNSVRNSFFSTDTTGGNLE